MQIKSSPSVPAGTGQATAQVERPASQTRAASSSAPASAGEVMQKADSAADAEQVKRAAAEINRQLKNAAQSIRFTVDEVLGKTIVRVVDSETGDVIRQIPSEEALAISRSIDRLQGVLLHQQA